MKREDLRVGQPVRINENYSEQSLARDLNAEGVVVRALAHTDDEKCVSVGPPAGSRGAAAIRWADDNWYQFLPEELDLIEVTP